MNTTNEQLARRWIEEIWNKRKYETVHEYFHPQGVSHLEGPPEAAAVHGPDALLAQFRIITDAFPDLHVVIDELISSGDDVVFRWTATGTHLGALGAIPVTHYKTSFNGMTWMKFRDGKQVEGWDRWNQGALLQKLALEHQALS